MKFKDNLKIMHDLFSKDLINCSESELLYKSPKYKLQASQEKIEGMLLGIAIGDSLGNTSESISPHKRHKRYGWITNYLPNKRANYKCIGLPSDDTQLSFDTLSVILEDDMLNVEHLAKIFSSHKIYGIGKSVRAFLHNYKDLHMPWFKSGTKSSGNGALMRISPIVVPYLNKERIDGIFADAVLDTMLTHNDALAIGSSVAFTDLILKLISQEKVDRISLLKEFTNILREVIGNEEYKSRHKLQKPFDEFENHPHEFIEKTVLYAIENHMPIENLSIAIGSGAYLLETVPISLYIILKYLDNPIEGILNAINNTKDNDTIGAIVSTSFGAFYGTKVFKSEWIAGLSGRINENDDGTIFKLIEKATEMNTKK
ncbi:MAG: ADP-ribosylglycohydrolase family protein [Candidatus Micrarchaeia archaeon]